LGHDSGDQGHMHGSDGGGPLAADSCLDRSGMAAAGDEVVQILERFENQGLMAAALARRPISLRRPRLIIRLRLRGPAD
jgi:hypothetical protein